MAEKKSPAQNFESFLKESVSSAEVSIDTEKLNKILNGDASSDDINTDNEEKNDEYSDNFESSDGVSEGSLDKRFSKQSNSEKKKESEEFSRNNMETQAVALNHEESDQVTNNLINTLEENTENDKVEVSNKNKPGGLGDEFISDEDVSQIELKKNEVDTKTQMNDKNENNYKVYKEKDNWNANSNIHNDSDENSFPRKEKSPIEINLTDRNMEKVEKLTENQNVKNISFNESINLEDQNNNFISSKNSNINDEISIDTEKEDGLTIKDINTINKLSDTAIDKHNPPSNTAPVTKELETLTKNDLLIENTTKTTPIQKLKTPNEIKIATPYIYPNYKNTPLKSPHTPLYSTFPPTSSSHPSSSSTNQSNPLPLNNFHDPTTNDNNLLRYSTSSSYCKETAERLKALEGLKRDLNGGRKKEQREGTDKNNEMKLKIENLEREVRSQDVILRGYQVEAERMYKELKVAKVVTGDETSRTDAGVDLLLEENASLKGQVIKLKKQLSMKEKLYSELESMASSRTMTESPRKKDSPKKINALNDNDKTKKKLNATLSNVTKVKKSPIILNKTYSHVAENKTPKPRSIGLKKVTEKSTDKNKKPQIRDIEAVDMTEVEGLRRDVKRLKREIKEKDEEFDARLSMYQAEFQVLKDKYHDHLKQLEEELDFYRQKTCNKKDEEKASESNNTDETKPEKDNVKKDEKNDEGDEGKAEKVGKSEKMSDLESVINSLKLQLSEKRLQEKVDEENEVRKLRIEISKLKGENFRLSEGFEEKNAEIEKITDEKLEIQKKLVSIEQQHHIDSQRFKNIFTSAQMADKARITSQENLIKNLKEELAEIVVRESLVDELKMEVGGLKEKLKTSRQETFEARSLQTPSSKMLQRLQGQLEEMEERLREREEQLQLLSGQSAFSYESDVIKKIKQRHAEELDLWKALVAEKSKDIDHFRDQLDQLLQVLKAAKILSSQQF